MFLCDMYCGAKMSMQKICKICCQTYLDEKEAIARRLKDSQQCLSNKDILIGILQDQLKRMEDNYKRSIDEMRDMRFKYLSAAEQLSTLRRVCEKLEEDSLKQEAEKPCDEQMCREFISMQNELESWKSQYKEILKKIGLLDCDGSIMCRIFSENEDTCNPNNANELAISRPQEIERSHEKFQQQLTNMENLLKDQISVLNRLAEKVAEYVDIVKNRDGTDNTVPKTINKAYEDKGDGCDISICSARRSTKIEKDSSHENTTRTSNKKDVCDISTCSTMSSVKSQKESFNVSAVEKFPETDSNLRENKVGCDMSTCSSLVSGKNEKDSSNKDRTLKTSDENTGGCDESTCSTLASPIRKRNIEDKVVCHNSTCKALSYADKTPECFLKQGFEISTASVLSAKSDKYPSTRNSTFTGNNSIKDIICEGNGFDLSMCSGVESSESGHNSLKPYLKMYAYPKRGPILGDDTALPPGFDTYEENKCNLTACNCEEGTETKGDSSESFSMKYAPPMPGTTSNDDDNTGLDPGMNICAENGYDLPTCSGLKGTKTDEDSLESFSKEYASPMPGHIFNIDDIYPHDDDDDDGCNCGEVNGLKAEIVRLQEENEKLRENELKVLEEPNHSGTLLSAKDSIIRTLEKENESLKAKLHELDELFEDYFEVQSLNYIGYRESRVSFCQMPALEEVSRSNLVKCELEEVVALKNTLASLLHGEREDVDALKYEIEKLKDTIFEQDEIITKLTREMDLTVQSNQELRDSLKKASTENDVHKAEIAKRSEKYSCLQCESNSLANQLTKAENEAALHKSQSKTLEEKCQQQNLRIKDLTNQLEKVQELADQLQSKSEQQCHKICALSSDLEQRNNFQQTYLTKLENAEKELQVLRSTMTSLQEERIANLNTISDLKNIINEDKLRMEKCVCRMEENYAEIDSLSQEVEELKAKCKCLLKEQEDNLNEISNLNETLQKQETYYSDGIKHLEEENQNLVEQLQQCEEQLRKIDEKSKTEISDLNNRIDNYKRRINDLEEASATKERTMKSKINDYENKIREMNTRLEGMDNLCSRLKDELQELSKERTTITQKYEQKIVTLQGDLEKCKQEHRTLQEELQNISRERNCMISKYEQRISSLDEALEECRQEKKQLQEDLNRNIRELQDSKICLETVEKDYEKQLKDMTNDMEKCKQNCKRAEEAENEKALELDRLKKQQKEIECYYEKKTAVLDEEISNYESMCQCLRNDLEKLQNTLHETRKYYDDKLKTAGEELCKCKAMCDNSRLNKIISETKECCENKIASQNNEIKRLEKLLQGLKDKEIDQSLEIEKLKQTLYEMELFYEQQVSQLKNELKRPLPSPQMPKSDSICCSCNTCNSYYSSTSEERDSVSTCLCSSMKSISSDDYNKLKQLNAKLSKDLENCRNKMKSLEEDIAEKDDAVKRLQKIIRTNENRIVELEAENKQLREEVEQILDENQNNITKIQELSQNLQDTSQLYEKKIKDSESEIHQLKSCNETCRRNEERMKLEKENMSFDLDSCMNKMTAYLNENNQMKEEMTKLKRDLECLCKERDDKSAQIDHLKARVSQMSRKCCQTSHEDLTELTEKYKKALTQCECEIRELNLELQQMQCDREKFKREKESLECKLCIMDKTLEQYKCESEYKRREVESLRQNEQKLLVEVQTGESSLCFGCSRIDSKQKLEDDYRALKADYIDLLEKDKEREIEIQELRSKLADFSNTNPCSSMIAELCSKKESYARLKRDYDDLKSLYDKHLDMYRGELVKLNQECQCPSNTSQVNRSELERTINELQLELMDKDVNIKTLQQKLSAKMYRIQELKQYCEVLLRNNQELKSKMNSCIRELEDKMKELFDTKCCIGGRPICSIANELLNKLEQMKDTRQLAASSSFLERIAHNLNSSEEDCACGPSKLPVTIPSTERTEKEMKLRRKCQQLEDQLKSKDKLIKQISCCSITPNMSFSDIPPIPLLPLGISLTNKNIPKPYVNTGNCRAISDDSCKRLMTEPSGNKYNSDSDSKSCLRMLSNHPCSTRDNLQQDRLTCTERYKSLLEECIRKHCPHAESDGDIISIEDVSDEDLKKKYLIP